MIAVSAQQRGFTLIELMITIVISMLILSGGIAAYFNFNDRQVLLGAGKQVQTSLRGAQTKARVGDRPAGCPKLVGYSVQSIGGGTQVQVSVVCDNGAGVLSSITDSTYTLPTQPVVTVSGLNVRFGVLKTGVTGVGTVTLTAGSLSYSFTISQGGEISDGQVVAQ